MKGEALLLSSGASAGTDASSLSGSVSVERGAPSSTQRKRHKGPRPKHVPQRMCIACREHDGKRGLYRIVRTPEGAVEPDPTGRRNGRGAYLCGRASCWERALSSGMLARALNVDIDANTLDALRRYAATLPLQTAMVGASDAQTGGDC
jgi:predicted RNA-binding protein YlxR (DUF448 family)